MWLPYTVLHSTSLHFTSRLPISPDLYETTYGLNRNNMTVNLGELRGPCAFHSFSELHSPLPQWHPSATSARALWHAIRSPNIPNCWGFQPEKAQTRPDQTIRVMRIPGHSFSPGGQQ